MAQHLSASSITAGVSRSSDAQRRVTGGSATNTNPGSNKQLCGTCHRKLPKIDDNLLKDSLRYSSSLVTNESGKDMSES